MMNELLDKLIIRFLFALLICLVLIIYKYAHIFLYPSSRQQLFRRFYPTQNAPDTIHLFSRILGIGIIFSHLSINMSYGIFWASLNFFIESILIFSMYLGSIYLLESMILYNFEYTDEIVKRKNYAYSLVSFVHALGVATVLAQIFTASQHSIILLLILWLFSIVMVGLTAKAYPFLSKLPFNKLLIQKNLAIAFSYGGHILGWTLLIANALKNETRDVQWYAVQIILKLLLAIIIFPLFCRGLTYVFRIQEEQEITQTSGEDIERDLGHGIYEGCLFLTACFLTAVVTEHIHFEHFYSH
jgi:uncharacterized membrane protein YjfL (UPF0719 family)